MDWGGVGGGQRVPGSLNVANLRQRHHGTRVLLKVFSVMFSTLLRSRIVVKSGSSAEHDRNDFSITFVYTACGSAECENVHVKRLSMVI